MQDGSGETSSSINPTSLAPVDVRPSNFVNISRPKGNISGRWVIDPEMELPDQQNLWNLHLSNEGVGSITAEVFVLPRTSPRPLDSIQLRFEAGGQLTLKLVGLLFSEMYYAISDLNEKREAFPDQNRHQIHLSLVGENMAIFLPRSFCGTLSLKRPHESIAYSAAIKANYTPFSEENGITKGFLGEFNHRQWRGWDQWEGDAVYALAEKTGTVKICYNGEDADDPAQSGCVCM